MTTTLKRMTNIITTLSLLLVMNLISSCSNNKDNNSKEDATTQDAAMKAKSVDTIVVNGTIKAVTFGKDGYTAEVQTDTEGVYAALVSIVNVGGREKYKPCDVGNKVSFKGTPSTLGDAKQLKVTEIISIEPSRTQLLISPISFRGIQIGDLIANHKDYIQKTKIKTGEGSFEVYEIKDFENNPAGYFLPDPKDKLLVGDITVSSPKAQTAKGIKIGGTFQDLLKAFPDIAVHGSEIESRTTATAHNISYRLDIANNKYDVDKTKIPPTTKITEITINRGAVAKALIAEAAYSKMQTEENCWQTNKVLVLRAEPSASSKAEGKHFQGETLKVLGTKMVGDQLWVNVTYTLSVKAGYEDKFADGRVTPSGSPTGWIGGAETPKINCK
jgi:hypothetical protein